MMSNVEANDLNIFRAEVKDVKGINSLISTAGGATLIRAAFGTYNLTAAVESTHLTLVATETVTTDEDAKDEKCIGCICIDDKVSLSSDGADSISIITEINDYVPVTATNSLFINLWVLDERAHSLYDTGVEIIRNAFAICSEVDFLLWLCPSTFITNEFIDKNFTMIDPLAVSADENDSKHFSMKGYKILFAHRSNFLPKLLVREARVEDNDDLIPILQKTNPEILVGQDNYFLADLIQNQDDKNRFFVGLKKQSIQGMLATSLDVNVSLILKIFDCDSYPDIVIKKEETPLPLPLIISIIGDLQLVELSSVQEMVQSSGAVLVDVSTLAFNESLAMSASRDESKSSGARDLISPVRLFIRAYEAKHTTKPPAYVVYGYPRTENEALDQARDFLSFDCVLELTNVNEDAEDDEDNEALQQHLDAIEALREHIQKNFTREKSPKWRKVTMDSGVHSSNEMIYLLSSELFKLLEQRKAQIAAQKAVDTEEAPSANAFAVTLFSVEEDFLSRGDDLLRIAFEEHPQQDYCMFMVPNDRPPSLLTQSFSFVKVRKGLSFDQSLYLMHRNFFVARDFIQVSRYTQQDQRLLSQFLLPYHESERNKISAQAQRALSENDVDLKDNPKEACFLVKIANNVVGVVVATKNFTADEDTAWIRANYNIDELVDCERHRSRAQATLTEWVLHPLYAKWSRFIVREIMRHYRKTLLYYQAPENFTPPKEVLEEFIHLNPRKRIQKANGRRDIEYSERPSHAKGGLPSSCPLYCLTKRTISKRKEIIAKRVVVVGGTSHAYAFLQTICSVPYLTFPNVYLLMERLPLPLHVEDPFDTALVDEQRRGVSSEESKFDDDYSGCLSVKDVEHPLEQELYAMGLAHKVNLVRGHMTDVDRENKAVVVSDEYVVEYDVLLISTCAQDSSTFSIPALAGLHSAKCTDIGVFELGNPAADLLALKWIRKRYTPKFDSSVVVYGSALNVFHASSKLIRLGIAAQRIVAVIPELAIYLAGVDDQVVTERIVDAATNSGVTIHWGHSIKDIGTSRSGFIDSVTVVDLFEEQSIAVHSTSREEAKVSRSISADYMSLESEGNQQMPQSTLPAMALLCCNQMNCDRYVFSAINDCGLVFDGGLIVDQSFRTVDPSIYAVSQYTRFSKIHKKLPPHSCNSSVELGTYLAIKILQNHLDPHSGSIDSMPAVAAKLSTSKVLSRNAQEGKDDERGSAMPKFQLPRAMCAELLGDLHYFHSKLPTLPEELYALPTYSDTNFDQSNTGGAINCVLKIDSFGVLSELEYVGDEPIEARNLAQLVGNHEALLNNLSHAYDKGLVTDWIEYFRGEWTNALYHDRFRAFYEGLRESLQKDKGMALILNRIFERAEDVHEDREVHQFRQEVLGVYGEALPESTTKAVRAEVVDFLAKNDATLSTYLKRDKGKA